MPSHTEVAIATPSGFLGAVELKFQAVDLVLTHPWEIANVPVTRTQTVVIVALRDADGVVGWGEAAPSVRYRESVPAVLDALARVDARQLSFADLGASRWYLDGLEPMPSAARCALDVALWDGAARRAGRALYDYLGLGFEEGRHVSSFTLGLDDPAVMRLKAQAAAHLPVLKVKLGGPNDAAVWSAVRETAPQARVRVDANEGWPTPEQALRKLEWLARDPAVEFVEQPMPASRPIADWIWLKERSPLPIFADESCQTAADVPRCAEGFHGVNVKLVKAGGLTGARAALEEARRFGLRTMLGCMIETSVLISAGAHLAGLCDHLDLDGNLLISNDPFLGVTQEAGRLTFAATPERTGLRVCPRPGTPFASWLTD